MEKFTKLRKRLQADIDKYRYRTALFIACSTFSNDAFEVRQLVDEFLEEADIVMGEIPDELISQIDTLTTIQDKRVVIGPMQSQRSS